MPPPNAPPFEPALSKRQQCTTASPFDCDSSDLNYNTSSQSLPIVAIVFIAIASIVGLILLSAYFRYIATHSPPKHKPINQCPTYAPPRPSRPISHSPPSPSPPTASAPSVSGSRRVPRSSTKAKKSKYVDPPPVYALTNLSESVLERAPGLMVAAAPEERRVEERRGSEGGRPGGTEELMAPSRWRRGERGREMVRESVPTYGEDEVSVVEARSGVITNVKDVSRAEDETWV